MDFQPKTIKRFWVAKPIYNQISVGFEPQVDYWTVAGDFDKTQSKDFAGFVTASPTQPKPQPKGFDTQSQAKNPFAVSFPQTKTVLTSLRLTKEIAIKLAEAFEKERVSSILEKRPAFYLRILRQVMSSPASVRDSWEMENGLLSDLHKPF